MWSWDITKLKGPVKWTYFYLYVIMDIWSRFLVGWMIAHRESAKLAEILIKESCRRQMIEREQLTIHADRGSSMRSKPVAFLLADLGVCKSHSRPYQSNDNPYIERLVKENSYYGFTYGLLRRAIEIKSTEMEKDVNELWTGIRGGEGVHFQSLEVIVSRHWADLNHAQKALALQLDLEPNFWERCESNWGSNITALLKGVTVAGIIACFVVVPVAAAVTPHVMGTYSNSCKDIEVSEYRSNIDRNIQGTLLNLEAKCLDDRGCDCYKSSTMIMTLDGSEC